MIKDLKNYQQGYMVLVATILVTAFGVLAAAGALYFATSFSGQAQALQFSAQARGVASGCSESAIAYLHANTSFLGTTTSTIASGTCVYTITSTGASSRSILASGTVSGVVRKVRILVTTSSFAITSWQEVAD